MERTYEGVSLQWLWTGEVRLMPMPISNKQVRDAFEREHKMRQEASKPEAVDDPPEEV